MAVNPPPPAPQLNSYSQLDVFVYHALAGSTENHRLTALGDRALSAAYTNALFHARADLHGLALQQHIDATFPAFVDRWVGEYGWRDKVSVTAGGVNLYDAQETLRIFQIYAGAVVRDLGQERLMDWIAVLVRTP